MKAYKIEMICYDPNFPQTTKTELLNRAAECEIRFGNENNKPD